METIVGGCYLCPGFTVADFERGPAGPRREPCKAFAGEKRAREHLEPIFVDAAVGHHPVRVVDHVDVLMATFHMAGRRAQAEPLSMRLADSSLDSGHDSGSRAGARSLTCVDVCGC